MAEDENTPWQYKPEDSPDDSGTDDESEDYAPERRSIGTDDSKNISWEASEFIAHEHGSGWYGMLILSTVLLSAVVFFLSGRDIVATVIIVFLGIAVGLYARRKPAIAKYEINGSGLKVNDKLYKYGDYKSFALIDEGALSSVNLIPLKRFMPPVSAYFDEKDEKKITDTLGNYLPYEPRKLDATERLSRRLRL